MGTINKLTIGLLLAAGVGMAWAQNGLESAKVTRVFNEVELLPPDQSAREAQVGDAVAGRTAVQTGNRSRAELTFNDQTLARMGGNSIFSFQRGTRDLNLERGVILLQVPKNAGGAKVNTAAVTAAVTGTTVMVEYDVDADGKGVMKFIVLEGEMRISLNGQLGESLLLGPGQMMTVPADASRLPNPVLVDLARLTETSGLMNSDFTPFPNEPLILEAAQEQQILKSKGDLITVDYGLKGKDQSPVLQTVTDTNQAQIRTNAMAVPQPQRQQPNRVTPVNRPAQVNRPPKVNPTPVPKPPRPDPPKRPKPPKAPRPQTPQPVPTPPPVPPAPEPPNSPINSTGPINTNI